MKLFKTTIVIWTDYDPDCVEIEDLAREATSGDGYCSKQLSEEVLDLKNDPDWDNTEFFDADDEEVA